jgi:hypothetical protein
LLALGPKPVDPPDADELRLFERPAERLPGRTSLLIAALNCGSR